jgi:hypothetical protein
MVEQGAVYIASTGFGLGDTEGLAGTEKLMTVFAEDVTQADATVGQALTRAKKRYLLGLNALTVYDEKSSIQFTLYGLPMYRLNADGSGVMSEMSGSGNLATASIPGSTGRTETLHLTVFDGASPLIEQEYTLTEVGGANGCYFTVDGSTQATPDRPIQPNIVVPIPDSASGDVHGFWYEQLVATEYTEYDPSISRITTEWEVDPQENQVAGTDGGRRSPSHSTRSRRSTATSGHASRRSS